MSVVARRLFRFLQPCNLPGHIIFWGDQRVICGFPRSLDGVLLHHKVRKNLDVDFEEITFPTPPLPPILKSRVSQLAHGALYSFQSSLPCRREINTYFYMTITETLPPALDNFVFIQPVLEIGTDINQPDHNWAKEKSTNYIVFILSNETKNYNST